MMGGAVIKKILLIPVAAACALALTAGQCSDPGAEAQRKALCATSRPICWSRSDSDEAVRQAKRHNAVGKALCNWTPKSHPCPKG